MKHALLCVVLCAACTLPQQKGDKGGPPPPPSADAGALAFDVAPVIDDLVLPDAVSPSPDGFYYLEGSISFHDDDDTVHELHVHVPIVGKTYVIPAGDQQRVTGENLVIKLIYDIPLAGAGLTSYDVSIVDSHGKESATQPRTVVLQ